MYELKKLNVDETVDVINTKINFEDCKEIIINDTLQIHVRVNSDNISVDFYKHNPEGNSESDFLEGTCFTEDDLHICEEIEVTTISADGSDTEITKIYTLKDRVELTDEQIGTVETFDEKADNDTLVEFIMNREHDRVVLIDIEGETIYEDEDYNELDEDEDDEDDEDEDY